MTSRRMKTSPAMACSKTLLAIFSFIFLIIGVAFVVAGILAKVKYAMFDELSTINFSTAPWVMIAIGCFILIVGVTGCCATIKGNTCLLRTYGLLLGLIFIFELGGAIVALVFRKQVNAGFEKGMTQAMKNYKENPQPFDQAQTTLHCCGVENYTDWWLLKNASSLPTNQVPLSCCKTGNCTKSEDGYIDVGIAKPDSVIYTTGCHKLIKDEVNKNLAIIVGTMFGVAFFQLIGLGLACCLASQINANKYELV